MTIRSAVQLTWTFTTLDANGSYTATASFRGLNYRFKDESGKIVSAGRATIGLTVTVNSKGKVTDVSSSEWSLTPNLVHLTDFVCPRLGGTAP